MMEEEPIFLRVEEVLSLHKMQLKKFGGGDGVRDIGLLESAVSQAQSSFDGIFVHGNLFEMASAYLFHIVNNHAFVDGNKRTGLLSALVFLQINGIKIHSESEALFELTIGVAEGRLDKINLTQKLIALAKVEPI